MMIENSGAMTEHGAVIDTRPANTPLHARPMLQFPESILPKMEQVSPPLAAARVVVTATSAAVDIAPSTATVDPQLNPYHPNHKINVPKAIRGTEWLVNTGALSLFI